MKKLNVLIITSSLYILITLFFSCQKGDGKEQRIVQDNDWFKLSMKYETGVYSTEKDFTLKFKKVLNDIESEFEQFSKEYKNETITYLLYFEKGQLIIENITSKEDFSELRIGFCDEYTDNKTCLSKNCVAIYMQEMMGQHKNYAAFKIKRNPFSAKICVRAYNDNYN